MLIWKDCGFNRMRTDSTNKQHILSQVFDTMNSDQTFPDYAEFRIVNRDNRELIDELIKNDFLRKAGQDPDEKIQLTLTGILQIDNENAKNTLKRSEELISILKNFYISSKGKGDIKIDQVVQSANRSPQEVKIELYFLSQLSFYKSMICSNEGFPTSIELNEKILDIESIEIELEKINSIKRNFMQTNQKNNTKTLKTAFSKYSVIEVIGQGGNGTVYRAKDSFDQQFAIKVLDPSKSTKEKLKRFKNEYLFCSRNTHKNIITVLDYGITSDDAPFFVMPIYDSSLRKRIGNISFNEAYQLFCTILDGVDAAHKQGAIHRDLKPENILVNANIKDLVIADFGIADFEADDLFTAVLTRDGTRLANFQYAAPEQRTKGSLVDKRADIYALGLILNELFTNKIPHGINFKTIGSADPDYSYLDALVEKMLQQEPTSRYESIEEIKKDLIAKGDEQVLLQKISVLKNTVIPITDLDDPIVNDPIKVIGGDWDNNILKIELSQAPNDTWIWSLRNMGNFTSVMGKGPDHFKFYGKTAIIQADKHEAQRIIDYFKDWLNITSRVYENKLKKGIEKNEQLRKSELAEKIRKEEEREKIKKSLRF